MRQQPFTSPEEALKHHGVKGMKWGVHKKDDVAPETTAARNEETKRMASPNLMVTKQATLPRTTSTGKVQAQARVDSHSGLSDKQKLALGIGAGAVVAGVGYLAYKHYANGSMPEAATIGKAWEHEAFQLKSSERLAVNTTKGYADMVPTGGPIHGFHTQAGLDAHAEAIRTLDVMREKYPTLKGMNIEVVPMSQVPGMEGMAMQRCPAAVMPGPKGYARLMYNDEMEALTESETEYVRSIQPGQLIKDFTGFHEMGHMLAVANGDLPDPASLLNAGSPTQQALKNLQYTRAKNKNHKDLLKKFGFSFKELSELSPYGATEPAEALAELSGYYHTPGQQSKLSSAQMKKAKALFDYMGGVTQ